MLLPAMIPAGFWLQSLDSFAIYTDYETPPGQILYIFSKLMGLYAVFLLWLQILLGLGRKMPNGQRPGISMTLHRNLGIATFAALVLHAALFVLAVSVRKEYFVYGLLLPVFNDGFYRLAVTLGILALYGLIFTLIAGVLRKQGKKWAVWMHRISLVAFALTLVHCLLIGTETRYFTMIALYSLMVISVAIALYCRSKNPKNLPSVG
jgi:predicted ferric reductase